MLIGDSHAAHLYPGMADLFRDPRTSLLQLNASSCPPLIDVAGEYSDNCRKANAFTFAKADELHPKTVFMDAEWTAYFDQDGFDSRLVKTVQHLLQYRTERMIIINPAPHWSPSLHQVLEDRFVKVGSPIPSHTNAGLDPTLLFVNDRLRSLAVVAGASFVSLTDKLCDTNGCLTSVGPNVSTDLLVYDSGHLTIAGAKLVAASIIAPALAGSKR